MRKFVYDEQAQDLVEYSLLMAFISLIAVSILSTTGSSIKGLFGQTSTALSSANASVPSAS